VRIAFQTLGRTIRHGYDNLGTLLMISLFWYVTAILLLPLGPTTAALHRITLPMTEERAASWRDFTAHLRADLRWSSLVFWTLALGFIVIGANIGFYEAAPAVGLRLIAIVFGTLAIVWTGIALFAFPLALRQDEQRLGMTLRNAVLMVIGNAPGVMLSYVLLIVLLGILTALPPLFLILPGVIALWSEEQARLLLVASGYVKPDEFADKPRVGGWFSGGDRTKKGRGR
jgi:uncharacterized membrane protein YesL